MSPNDSLFVDTSGWAAPVIHNVTRSAELEAFSRTLITGGRTLVTTNHILAELIALLTIRTQQSRAQNLAFINQIKQRAYIVHIDQATDAEAWAMLGQYTDKEWSLVDAASFVVMRQMGDHRSVHDRPSLRAGRIHPRPRIAARIWHNER